MIGVNKRSSSHRLLSEIAIISVSPALHFRVNEQSACCYSFVLRSVLLTFKLSLIRLLCAISARATVRCTFQARGMRYKENHEVSSGSHVLSAPFKASLTFCKRTYAKRCVAQVHVSRLSYRKLTDSSHCVGTILLSASMPCR